MTEIDKVFSRKAFIPFITVGDPDMETSEKLVRAMAENGADLIELGLAFADPVAEGPVIQEADNRALAAGTNTDKLFDMAGRVHADTSVPLAIMTYINPVFVYGPERFMKKCKESGICALIVPDMPYEEKGDLQDYCTQYGVKLVSMVAPTSKSRVSKIASEAEGYIYVVSSMGVTGVRSGNEFSSNLNEIIDTIRSVTDVPCAIGFGISTPEQAKQMGSLADGIIIGSAIVRIVAEHGRDSVPYVTEFIKSVREALDSL